MRRVAIAVLLLGWLLVARSFAQSGAVIPQGGAGHAAQASCIILKRMGRTLKVSGGSSVHLNAQLEKAAAP